MVDLLTNSRTGSMPRSTYCYAVCLKFPHSGCLGMPRNGYRSGTLQQGQQHSAATPRQSARQNYMQDLILRQTRPLGRFTTMRCSASPGLLAVPSCAGPSGGTGCDVHLGVISNSRFYGFFGSRVYLNALKHCNVPHILSRTVLLSRKASPPVFWKMLGESKGRPQTILLDSRK